VTDPDDHHEYLGVSPGAGAAELRRAYRKLALRCEAEAGGMASISMRVPVRGPHGESEELYSPVSFRVRC
jgi:curved DNA-binding protein CbpA